MISKRKIETTIICLIMIFGIISATSSTVHANDHIAFRGYVYYDSNITIPDEVIIHVEGEELPPANIPGNPIGYYSIDFEASLGDEITFDVMIFDYNYENLITHIIDKPFNTNFNLTIDTSVNHNPNIPNSPTPSDDATNRKINVNLEWSGGDPDGDNVTYDVYFSATNPPTSIVSPNQSSTTYDPGALSYKTDYYWQIISWDEHGASSDGPIWHFRTKSDTSSSGGGGSGGSSSGVTSNIQPTAKAVASATTVTIGEIISFDGSQSEDPDGNITLWDWDFDNDKTVDKSGEIVTHSYSNPGTYEVQLIVKDNEDEYDELNTPLIIVVTQLNNPPEKPTITGPTYENRDNKILFSLAITDPDENDTIDVIVNWDDLSDIFTSQNHSNNDSFQINHTWTSYGVYTIKVEAIDQNNASSGYQTHMIYIDVYPIDDDIIGLLIDIENDDIYNVFNNSATGKETKVELQEQQKYLIDADGDELWDYIFDVETDTLIAYTYDEVESEDNLGLILLILVVVLIFILLGYIVYKRERDNQKQIEEQKAKKTKSASTEKPPQKKNSKKSTKKK